MESGTAINGRGTAYVATRGGRDEATPDGMRATEAISVSVAPRAPDVGEVPMANTPAPRCPDLGRSGAFKVATHAAVPAAGTHVMAESPEPITEPLSCEAGPANATLDTLRKGTVGGTCGAAAITPRI